MKEDSILTSLYGVRAGRQLEFGVSQKRSTAPSVLSRHFTGGLPSGDNLVVVFPEIEILA